MTCRTCATPLDPQDEARGQCIACFTEAYGATPTDPTTAETGQTTERGTPRLTHTVP